MFLEPLTSQHVGPLYVTRLLKSLTHVAAPYSGGVAEFFPPFFVLLLLPSLLSSKTFLVFPFSLINKDKIVCSMLKLYYNYPLCYTISL